MALTVNADQHIADMLLELKRHMKVCPRCEVAMKAADTSGLCYHTIALIMGIARGYDTLIPRRIRAHRKGVSVVYACPDLGAHGKTYPLIAEPLQVVGVQGALF